MDFSKEAVDCDFEKLGDFNTVVRHIIVVGEVIIDPSRSSCQLLQDLLHIGKPFCWSSHALESRIPDVSYNQVINLNKLLEDGMVLYVKHDPHQLAKFDYP